MSGRSTATTSSRRTSFRAELGLGPGNSAIVAADVAGAALAFERAGIRAAVRAGSLRASFPPL